MVDKKVVLVRFGNSSRGVSFSSDGGNDREALEKAIRKVYREEIPEDTPFFQTVGIVNVSIVPMNWLQHFHPTKIMAWPNHSILCSFSYKIFCQFYD